MNKLTLLLSLLLTTSSTIFAADSHVLSPATEWIMIMSIAIAKWLGL